MQIECCALDYISSNLSYPRRADPRQLRTLLLDSLAALEDLYNAAELESCGLGTLKDLRSFLELDDEALVRTWRLGDEHPHWVSRLRDALHLVGTALMSTQIRLASTVEALTIVCTPLKAVRSIPRTPSPPPPPYCASIQELVLLRENSPSSVNQHLAFLLAVLIPASAGLLRSPPPLARRARSDQSQRSAAASSNQPDPIRSNLRLVSRTPAGLPRRRSPRPPGGSQSPHWLSSPLERALDRTSLSSQLSWTDKNLNLLPL